MAHVQKQIRDAAITLLNAAAGDTTWRRAYGMSQTLARDLLPYVLVYFADEVIEPDDVHGQELVRESLLTVRARVRILGDGELLEDSMDAVAAAVESALTRSALNALLSNKLYLFTLTATVRDSEAEDENERSFAEVVLDYRVQYATADGQPETLI